jgi:hypothetical protein
MDTYIRHPYTGNLYLLRVPAFTLAENVNPDAEARFAYYIDPDGRFGSMDRSLLKIVMTGPVFFKVKQSARQPGDPPETVRATGFMEAFRVRDFTRVPVHGSDGSDWPLDPVPMPQPTRIRRLRTDLDAVRESRRWVEVDPRRDPTLREEIASAVVDTAVGLVPVVGDLVDIGELAVGLVTGKDRWGRTLGVGDLALMGAGAVLPFVSGGALRAAGDLTPLFGKRAGEFADLIEQLRRASWSEGEQALLRDLDQMVRHGGRPTAQQAQQFLSLLQRAPAEHPGMGSLLNASGTGFSHPQLQQAFRRNRRSGEDPMAWALRENGQGPLKVLRALFGPDLAAARRRALKRLVDLAAIPRPDSMTRWKERKLLTALLGDPDKLFDRLRPLLQRLRSGDASARALLNEGLFRILKGNIGEILSMKVQMDVLRQIQTWPPYRSARLFTGVRVRLPRGGRLPLFSDNIIAVTGRTPEGREYMKVLAVFEVKSGYEGGTTVQRQVFRWVERNVEDGSELILPDGSKFTYKPAGAGVAEVTHLTTADRYTFIARGLSHLGVEGENIAGRVFRHFLPATSKEMDWLVAAVLRAFMAD